MTVYVDNARIPYGRMIMCHMVADTEAELHAMADSIGVARRHYHRCHYNICVKKRALACSLGAKECTKRQAAILRRAIENSAIYITPAHGWTCFHCGETFHTVEAARDHFGATPDATPGCMIRVDDRSLLSALREAQEEAERLRSDERECAEYWRLRDEHQRALRKAEEEGYEKGLRDGRAEAMS